ncbi:MAG: GTPase ObgE [Proteobacteria bacterium]|nr:GTPase ObgE [Pseudomonadota bacterium]
MAYKHAQSFIDHITIIIKAGDGGHGCVSFATTRGGAKLGADGGHGGRGGDVWLVAKENLHSLSSLVNGQIYKAEDGKHGSSQKKKGAQGKDLKIALPLGCDIFDETTQTLLATLNHPNKELLIHKGGHGGLGNVAFLSATNQRPRNATQGKPGTQKRLRITLKLIAHVALAGFANAGKSTLLRALSRAKPEVGNYPFTTLTPQLGVMDHIHPDEHTQTHWIIADIPGLIKDSSQGKGLGHEFLRHLERTSLIALVIALDDAYTNKALSASNQQNHIEKTLKALRKEIYAYGDILKNIPKMLIITHMDKLSYRSQLHHITNALACCPYEYILVSAHSGEGIEDLKNQLHTQLLKLNTPTPKQQTTTATQETPRHLTEKEEQFLKDLIDISVKTTTKP